MFKRFLCTMLSCIFIFSSVCFANIKNPYYIKINRAKNFVSVYALDKNNEYTVNTKNFICSTGKDTPDGTFNTSNKYLWRALFGNVFGQYATRITGHILFHSVPYYTQNKNDLEYPEYGKLGTTASMGCIRLTAADAKWIYDNCPSGTTVKIYNDPSEAMPNYEKPPVLDLTDVKRRGWDPTDPDINNPWKKEEVKINSYAVVNELNCNINEKQKTIKGCLIEDTNYIYIKDMGKFFNGFYLANADKDNFEFKKSKYYVYKVNSVLDYFIKPYGFTEKNINIKYGFENFNITAKIVNGYTFIKLTDAAKIAKTAIKIDGENVTLTY